MGGKTGGRPNLPIDDKKMCGHCKQVLPVEVFHSDRRTASGLSSSCSGCSRPSRRAYRYENHDKILEAGRKRWASLDEEGKAKRAEHTRRTKAKYPERFAARSLFNRAIRAGKIVRQPCSSCGKPNAHGHHHDYTKPYEVEWMCVSCHHKQHRTTPEGLADLRGERVSAAAAKPERPTPIRKRVAK